MAEESAQQPTGELEPAPAANRRASLQDNTSKQPSKRRLCRPRSREERIIRFLASLLCLAIAGYDGYQGQQVWCLIFCGIATGAIDPWNLVRTMLLRQSTQNDETNE